MEFNQLQLEITGNVCWIYVKWGREKLQWLRTGVEVFESTDKFLLEGPDDIGIASDDTLRRVA